MDTLKEIGVQRWKRREATLAVTATSAVEKPAGSALGLTSEAIGLEQNARASNADSNSLAVADAAPAVMQSVMTEDKTLEDQEQQTPESLSSSSQQQYDWQSLSDLLGSGTNCSSCATTNPVLGDGNINAQWMVVIDGPSARDMHGQKLLSGRQGQLFDSILQALGLTREEIYLTSVFKCPPSSDSSIVAQCGDLIHHQTMLVKPRLILAMGEFSAQSLLRANEDLNHLRSSDNSYPGGSSVVVCTYSLAQMLRDPGLKAEVWQDLKKCSAILH